jgi:hypothetical protein
MEQRESPRHKCFLRAFVYLEDSIAAMECIVRELSDVGARLEFPGPRNFTEFLDLHIPIKGQNFRSKVQWQEGNEIGVAFHVTTNTGDVGVDKRMDQLEVEIAKLKHAVKHLQRKTANQKPEAA